MDLKRWCDIGMIGLGVMGENLVLNLVDKGFQVAVFDPWVTRVDEFMNGSANGLPVAGTHNLAEFVDALEQPRRIMLMIKAGEPVDALIEQLQPRLAAGDILIDGGNSFFQDTRRRFRSLEAKGIRFVGMGVSGGAEGALNGPSLMAGGDPQAYAAIAPLFTRIAAQVAGGPCCALVGGDGAGHYVKMVHNGIEYADMQLIAEAYDILRRAGGLTAGELREVFTRWNAGPLESYLIEISGRIMGVTDPDSGLPLVEMILDKAGQKGTGKWASQSALDLGVPTPTITAAVFARYLSAGKDQRLKATVLLHGPQTPQQPSHGEREKLIEAVHDALYASKICSYAQGFALLAAAAREYGWTLRFGDIAMLWRGGCIIRARFLDRIRDAFADDAELSNLMLAPFFAQVLASAQDAWRLALKLCRDLGIAAPAFNASLDYYDACRQPDSPANLIQAQRDYFGAHTYERIDRPGVFHTDWVQESQ